MDRIAIIGAGDVAKAAAVKIMQMRPDTELTVISRSSENLDRLISTVRDKTGCQINHLVVDVMEHAPLVANFITLSSISSVLNLASPYTNMVVMRICLDSGCNYLDTACYEEKGTKGFSYKDQLSLKADFIRLGLTAILGAGGSPGVTNALAARMNLQRMSGIDRLRIMDGNAGRQNKYRFCTNFSPEDNLKELDNPARWYDNGVWREEPAFSTSNFNTDHGLEYYRIFHEELETLVWNIPSLRYAANYMSFGEDYINCFKVLRDVGMLSHVPAMQGIAPIEFLSKVLPHPQDVAQALDGKAFMRVVAQCIGHHEDMIEWVMDHQECFEDTGTGAVAWSTGVPAVAFSTLLDKTDPGVFNVEELNNDESIKALISHGIYLQEKTLGGWVKINE